MIITQTPLRISFAGGGTDFKEFWEKEGGSVISSAIDRYVYVIIKERFDDLIVLNYTKKEIVAKVDDIEHGLIREAMRKTEITHGVEITTLADIPSEGSGLGSSSSITVGLLNTFYSYQGELVTAERLAKEACEIEIDILGSPIGIQDQYIAAYGNFRIFKFDQDGTVQVERLNILDSKRLKFGSNLHLFFLNKTRKSETILREQKANIQAKRNVLCKMRDTVPKIRKALLNNSFDEVGMMLHECWEEKKKLSRQISNPEIDEFYHQALNAGALGGKVSGAGAGGFLLIYCPQSCQERLSIKMNELGLRELPFHLESDGSKVIFNQRRYRWK